MAEPSSQLVTARVAIREHYWSRGFVTRLGVLQEEEANALRKELAAYAAWCPGGMTGDWRFKSHLILPWCHARMVCAAPLLEAVQDLIGPDVLCWSSGWAVKEPGSQGFYSWHQDSTYASITHSDQVVTAWIALTESTSHMGCVRYIQGSHMEGQLPHSETFAEDNMLSRGQCVVPAVDEASAYDAVLSPGQASLHHFHCVHGSCPNHSSEARIGLQVVYMPVKCAPKSGSGSAMLVCGEDCFNHWALEPAPHMSMGRDEVEAHANAMRIENQAYFESSAGRTTYHK